MKDIDLISIKKHWLKYLLKHKGSKKFGKINEEEFLQFFFPQKYPQKKQTYIFSLISLSWFQPEQS